MGRGGLISVENRLAEIRPEPEGNTPLDDDEAAGLIPEHLTTRGQLNEWEQANISAAIEWLHNQGTEEAVLEPAFLNDLHRRMFGNTWTWAGSYRKTEKNIGVAPYKIPEEMLNLLADVRYWIEHDTFPVDEIGARFHHRLVSIHPYPNGNGRHARLATDLLLELLGARRFTWGSGNLDQQGDLRSRYIHALRKADKGAIGELTAFCRE